MSAFEIWDIHHKCVALYYCIHNWHQAQMVYAMCHVHPLSLITNLDDPDDCPPERVENTPLYLPSSLPSFLPTQLCVTGLSSGLAGKEIRLRVDTRDTRVYA
jgi:hypothetical protein